MTGLGRYPGVTAIEDRDTGVRWIAWLTETGKLRRSPTMEIVTNQRHYFEAGDGRRKIIPVRHP